MERVRVWLWPRRSWPRSLRYVMYRLIRMRAAPHQVALGCAIGVFTSITPLFGLQMILAVALAFLLRANIAASLLGTFFGNPVTWPVIWATTYTVGCAMLGVPGGLDISMLSQNVEQFAEAVGRLSPELVLAAGDILWPLVKPMLIGSMPIGILASIVFYYVCRRAAASYALRRARRLNARLVPAYG